MVQKKEPSLFLLTETYGNILPAVKSELQGETAERMDFSEQLSNEHLAQIGHLFPLLLKNLTKLIGLFILKMILIYLLMQISSIINFFQTLTCVVTRKKLYKEQLSLLVAMYWASILSQTW